MEIKEVNVPVPWGHIAVKVWGKESDAGVLVVHGLLDNAGAMDGLIERLPATCCYYALDLPGHGRSSHWPRAAVVHDVDQVLALHAVATHFRRTRYAIVGHSWGAQLALFYAIVYPERVVRLALIDAVFLFSHATDTLPDALRRHHRQYFATMAKLNEGGGPPTYTRETALDRIMQRRFYGELKRAAAERLLVRMTRPAAEDGDRVCFTTDQRLKFVVPFFTDLRYIAELFRLHPVRCPVLVIVASESKFLTLYARQLDIVRREKNFTVRHVTGTHDVHNNHPEIVAPLIYDFLILEHANSKL